ncbi:hypothetical protein B0H13DRAFT_2649330 [Mycena leptocephala]|nr:hypothetical protein B0H13DRAFT_2649330 [Mycena leptocephala]
MDAAEFLHSAIVGLQNLVITRYVSGVQLPLIISSSANPNCVCYQLAAGFLILLYRLPPPNFDTEVEFVWKAPPSIEKTLFQCCVDVRLDHHSLPLSVRPSFLGASPGHKSFQILQGPQVAPVFNVSSVPASKNDDRLKPRGHPSRTFKASRIRLLLLHTLGLPSCSRSRTPQDSGYIQDLFEPSNVALHTSYSKYPPVSSLGRGMSMSSARRETKPHACPLTTSLPFILDPRNVHPILSAPCERHGTARRLSAPYTLRHLPLQIG